MYPLLWQSSVKVVERHLAERLSCLHSAIGNTGDVLFPVHSIDFEYQNSKIVSNFCIFLC